jgi:hypothetical protein
MGSQTPNSKVTGMNTTVICGASNAKNDLVEYFDPSGLFPLLSPGLLQRLPLRDLRWRGESRSINTRSIEFLHVDLVPHSQLSSVRDETTSTSRDGDGPSQQDQSQARITGIDARDNKGGKRERRHQIPGLRPTPYLKLYLLRCDDNDTYKSSSRKQIQDWLNEHGPPAAGFSASGQESHDAFDWIVVHVVLPNTQAAAQPRTTSSKESAGDSRSSSTSRWPGRSSSTILDKLRSSFKREHIAQIRIPQNEMPVHVPPTMLKPQGAESAYVETKQEQQQSWAEVIDFMKTMILSSFGIRVKRYEEDIKDRDSQRRLPGWNFCTFFVLKEGLAIAFESVGLVEDALKGYDELRVDLDGLVRSQNDAEHDAPPAATFLPYTLDVWKQALYIAESATPSITQTSLSPPETPQSSIETISTTRRAYRDLVLENNISLFDFRCYIFARQLSLLLRLSNVSYLQTQDVSSSSVSTPENLPYLAEVCTRAMEFITETSRILRADLWSAYSAYSSSNTERNETIPAKTIAIIIDNIVSSWTFSISEQILAQTSTKHIPIATVDLLRDQTSELNSPSKRRSGSEQKVAIMEGKTRVAPGQRGSAPFSDSNHQESLRQAAFVAYEEQTTHPDTSLYSHAGLQNLCSRRAELYLLGRAVAERLGNNLGWLTDIPEIGFATPLTTDFQEVDLDGPDGSTSKNPYSNLLADDLKQSGLASDTLRMAVADKAALLILFEVSQTLLLLL